MSVLCDINKHTFLFSIKVLSFNKMDWIKYTMYFLYIGLFWNVKIGCLTATMSRRSKREVTTIPPSTYCPVNWLEFNNRCYYFISSNDYTWDQANRTCVNLGGNLASIHSTQENEFILSHVNTIVWIGLFQQHQETPFEWSDGTDTDFLLWANGEPNDRGGPELCTEFFHNSVVEGKRGAWNDKICTQLNGLVCANIENNCLSVNCLHGGSCVHTYDSYVCICRYGFYGRHCEHVVSSFPTVLNFWPFAGPVSGGTTLTVVASNLPIEAGISITIKLGAIQCETTYQDSNTLIGTTPHLLENQSITLNQELPVTIAFQDGTVLETDHIFVYKSDPVIRSLHPKKTIIKGGTYLTIIGESFRSISEPTMITFMKHSKVINKTPLVYRASTDSYETACQVQSNTKMICETAQINLPKDFRPVIKNERKRDLHTDSTKQDSSHRLVKREAVPIERSVNGDTFEFYIGFKLDGVEDFKNYSFVGVYANPTFQRGADVIDYIAGMSISFIGDNLDVGITLDDYIINIGTGTCSNYTLLSNSLSCYPPESSPQLKQHNSGSYPEIIIHVGTNIEHFAGYMRYKQPYTKSPCTETASWKRFTIISSTLAGIAVVVCVVVVTVVSIKRRNAPKENSGDINNGYDLDDRNYAKLDHVSQN